MADDETDDWQSAPTQETDDWQPAQPAISQSEVDDWQAAPAPADDWQAPQSQLPKAESPFWSGVRKFAHGIGPTLAGAAAGAATMSGYGTVAGTMGWPGPGTLVGGGIGLVGGLITGGVSGYLASEAQEAAAKALNFDDSLQLAANEQANPGSTLIGGALTAAVPFGMGRGVVTLGQRAFSGALMGGVETGSELAEGKPLDPAAIALNVGMGAAFPQPRKLLTPFESAGARLGTRLAEQFHGKAGPDAAGGVAQEQPAPVTGTTVEPGAAAATPEATAPAGDRGGAEDYGKAAPPPAAVQQEGGTEGLVPDPALDAAIRAKMAPEGEGAAATAEPEIPGEPPPGQQAAPAGPWEEAVNRDFPRVPNADEQARPLRPEPPAAEPPAAEPPPAAPQRPADEGLFGDTHLQGDLLTAQPTATAKLSDTDLRAAHQQAVEQFRKTVEQSADMTSPEIAAAKSRVQELGNELAARRAPQQQSDLEPVPVVAPLKPTRQPSDYTGKLDPNISASDYVQRMTEMQVNKPRPINKLWRNADTAPPGAVADQIRKIKDWNNEYAKVSKNQKLALERDNAAYRAQQEGKAHSLSAAAAPPTAPITTSAPPSTPAGKIFAGLKQAADNLFDMTSGLVRDLQMKVAPMATGTKETILPAKDFANRLRQIHQDWQTADEAIVKKFNPEQQKRIWDAMNEEREMQKKGEVNEHMGVATLEPDERAFADDFHTQAKARWARLLELGVVKGEGEPYWTPIMLAHAMDKGEGGGALDRIGGNLKTTTGSLKRRKYETAEETEAAMKKLFGEQAGIARNARVMPLALSKLDQVIAGRELVDKIREIGKATGTDTVALGAKPAGPGWFHIDHPALYDMRIRPRTEEADTPVYREAVEGHGVVKVPPAEIPLFDRNGKPVLNYDRVPLWIRGDFEGPLRAVLSKQSGVAYTRLMELKGKTMGLIMNSPMIHLAVEIGRALPSMPGKILSGRIFFDGNRAKFDPVTTREAIGGGQDPIGKRYFNQDISSMMEQPNLTPGRSWTSQVLSFVPGLFDEKAGLAVKQAIDKAGDFWHNTLLWDRVRDLQMGLYVNYRDNLVAKGVSREEAVILAAHWSNRFAGSLPQEAMSASARKVANLLLFSRTFTLGNLGVMKDMFTGAPRDTLAMLERAGGSQKALDAAKSMARRKAISIVALDMGLMYIGNSLLQSASNVMRGDKTLDQEGQGYADRLSAALQNVREHPLSMLQPMSLAQSLSATSENEPGKQDRILVGHTKDGTGIYARNPVGKIGEEFAGYLSGPLDMLHRKLGTLARPTWQVLANDRGFGRKVYDPNADSIGDYVKNAGAIATHFATAQLPDIQLSGAYNALTGQGDTTLATTQALGPLAGVTFSKGAPGGPAVGELYKEAERQRFAVNEALPEIRQMITNNDIPGAMKRMIDLKMPAWQRNITIRQALNPSARLTPTAVQKFNRTASPEERARFERMRQQNIQ
jgi:hypothetical protein